MQSFHPRMTCYYLSNLWIQCPSHLPPLGPMATCALSSLACFCALCLPLGAFRSIFDPALYFIHFQSCALSAYMTLHGCLNSNRVWILLVIELADCGSVNREYVEPKWPICELANSTGRHHLNLFNHRLRVPTLWREGLFPMCIPCSWKSVEVEFLFDPVCRICSLRNWKIRAWNGTRAVRRWHHR